MEESTITFAEMAASTKRFARRLFTIGENRVELLVVEVEQERERLLQAIWMLFGIAAFSLLAVMSFSGVIVLLIWQYSPIAAFLVLTALYTAGGLFFLRRFNLLKRNWKSFAATLDQLRKDRECLEKNIE